MFLVFCSPVESCLSIDRPPLIFIAGGLTRPKTIRWPPSLDSDADDIDGFLSLAEDDDEWWWPGDGLAGLVSDEPNNEAGGGGGGAGGRFDLLL